VVDLTTGETHVVAAGADPPLLVRGATGAGQELYTTGILVGADRTSLYDGLTVFLEPGDTLLLTTDGVTEATNAGDVEYGRERLVEAARAGKHLSANSLINFIHHDMLKWTNGRGSDDDATFVIVKTL